MDITDGLYNLWQNTGIYNLILSPDPKLHGVAQFLHVFGHPIMLVICLFSFLQILEIDLKKSRDNGILNI